MSTYTDALHVLFPTPRAGQLQVDSLIGPEHLALEAPTGSGKSGIAVALGAHFGGAQIVTHSNALSSQYLDDLAVWAPKLGITYARLAGRKHYWCPAADPGMANIEPKFRQAVTDNEGCFIGTGMKEFEYRKSSLDGLRAYDPEADEADQEANTTECQDCEWFPACPLWTAREKACSADIVVTNAALSAVSLKLDYDIRNSPEKYDPQGPDEDDKPWPARIVRPLLVIDEADSCESLYRTVLIPSRTISRSVRMEPKGSTVRESVFTAQACQHAADGAMAAVAQLEKVAPRFVKIDEWLRLLTAEDGTYRTPEIQIDKDRDGVPKIELRLPNKLDRFFAGHRVVAMSATFTHMQARWLGVQVEACHQLPGLDLSNCQVVAHSTFPAWKWAEKNPAEHAKWAKAVADVIEARFKEGATAGLFQSNADLDAVHGELMRRRIKAAVYRAGEDRESVIAAHKADPRKMVLLGCFAGAGRGMNLPGDLLEHVVISRIPQNPPKGAEGKLAKMRWTVGSMSDVVQAAGRVSRFDGDRGTVDVLGGFGSRYDVREALSSRGWPMTSK